MLGIGKYTFYHVRILCNLGNECRNAVVFHVSCDSGNAGNRKVYLFMSVYHVMLTMEWNGNVYLRVMRGITGIREVYLTYRVMRAIKKSITIKS